jgi:hypothetical protein
MTITPDRRQFLGGDLERHACAGWPDTKCSIETIAIMLGYSDATALLVGTNIKRRRLILHQISAGRPNDPSRSYAASLHG